MLVFLLTIACWLPGGEGIIPLGPNGVLICGEAITLNATENISDKELDEMLFNAQEERRENCP